jgi:hypothetical protein
VYREKLKISLHENKELLGQEEGVQIPQHLKIPKMVTL